MLTSSPMERQIKNEKQKENHEKQGIRILLFEKDLEFLESYQ